MGAVNPLGAIVFFDGVCYLCSEAVLFIIRHDRKATFSFATLQSPFGQQWLQKAGLRSDELSTIVLLMHGRIFTQSNAVLEIAKNLDRLWPALYVFKLIPAFIRDKMYRYIANNRYHWFGEKQTCMIPTPELKARFIDMDDESSMPNLDSE